jgi:RNA polymerase sigma-70 factor (ECF subfamily)
MSIGCVSASGPSEAEATDAELVARARDGDHAAFGELVDRHRAAVYRAALAALGSHADADDVAQDAFVSAFTRLRSFRGDASFKTWLLTITWNQALNRRRRLSRLWRRFAAEAGSARGHASPRLRAAEGEHQRKYAPGVGPRREWKEVGEDVAEIPGSEPSPEQAASGAQLRRDIVAEIRALSPKLRDALLLAQAGEYRYDEIAAMLGTAVGTIKWRVSEARRVIRKRLNERGYASL